MNKKSYRSTNIECSDLGGEGWGCSWIFWGQLILYSLYSILFLYDYTYMYQPENRASFIIMLKSSLFQMLSWCSCNTNWLLRLFVK